MKGIGQTLLACHASVYRYARALSHDPFEADDLVQETYKRALAAKRKPTRADEVNVRPWLFTIMRHIWQNEIRHRLHDTPEANEHDIQAVWVAESPEAILTRKLLQSEIRHAIDSLPEVFREVIVLREIETLSYAQIASVLHCPQGTVMSRLARGRALLRHLFVNAGLSSKEASR